MKTNLNDEVSFYKALKPLFWINVNIRWSKNIMRKY